jgi:predicted nuclease with RNAse H fold
MHVKMARAFTTFLGVDLGGGKGKNTAVARLQRTDDGVVVVYVSTRTPSGELFFDAPLLAYLLENAEGAVLSVDAPLLPSVCMRCRLEVCRGLEACQDPVVRWFGAISDELGRPRQSKPAVTAYTQRACEVLLHERHGILPRETLGQGMGPLTARAHYLRRALESTGRFALNRNLIEVYPKATVHALCGALVARRYKRDVSTWSTRARILEGLPDLRFEVWREGCLKNDHCFDAVVAAYTGYLWARDGWELPEVDRSIFERDGWIWFPPVDRRDD